MGAITVANQSVLHDRPIDWRVPIATGILTGIFALLEHAWEDGAVALAWLALGTILFTRVDPNVPSPAESLNAYLQKG
jgi:hypothetical protein